MKKFLYVFAIAGIFSTLAFTAPNTNISQKVLDNFNKTFAGVQNVHWFSVEDGFTATFEQDGIRNIISYNKNGSFLSSRRYYNQRHLPFGILLKIKEKYNGKTIGIVTEFIQDENITYSVNVEDETKVYVLEINGGSPSITLRSNFRKQTLEK